MQKRNNDPKAKIFEEQVIEVKSVTKVNKGGRQRRFSATVVVGDRHGQVGLGMGKANEVPDAIKKAIQDANKNLIKEHTISEKKINYDKEDYIYGLKKLIPRASEEELEKKAKEQLELLDKIS